MFEWQILKKKNVSDVRHTSGSRGSIFQRPYEGIHHRNIFVQKLPQISTSHIVKIGVIWG